MSTKISRDEVTRLCHAICRRLGEKYCGPFSFEVDAVQGSVFLSLKGEKSWYRVREKEDGLEVFDNAGTFLGSVSGLHLPQLGQDLELEIDSSLPAREPVFGDVMPPGKAVMAPEVGGLSSTIVYPRQDAAEILDVVQKILHNSQGIFSVINEKDSVLWLAIDIPAEKLPAMRLIVTVQDSGKRNEDGRLSQEKVVLIRLFTRVFITPEQRSATLEIINRHHNHSWAGCFRIHDDGELEGNWAQNVLETGIAVSYLWDGLIRLLTGWRSLFDEVVGTSGG